MSIEIKKGLWGGSALRPPQLLRMKMSLPRHDLLGEERLLISQRRKGQEPFSQWAFIGLNLHRNIGHICKTHQSLSDSKDQTIDNIQRTLRAYFESGSDS